jgi:hypothetical protein
MVLPDEIMYQSPDDVRVDGKLLGSVIIKRVDTECRTIYVSENVYPLTRFLRNLSSYSHRRSDLTFRLSNDASALQKRLLKSLI